MSDHTNLDAHEVHERLWVGSVPPRGPGLARLGFTHVVLCANDFQFAASDFDGVTVVHCPFEDSDTVVSGATTALVFATARAVSEAQRAGGTVLVTCAAGINRSALVAALAMRMLGVQPWAAVERIRATRFTYCLSNTCFRRIALGENHAAAFYLPKVRDPVMGSGKPSGDQRWDTCSTPAPPTVEEAVELWEREKEAHR